MSTTATSMSLLPLLIAVLAMYDSVVSGDAGRYCDSKYESVRLDCCTPRAVMPYIGQCCLPSISDCRCRRDLLGEAQYAVCTANFIPPAPAPMTAATTPKSSFWPFPSLTESPAAPTTTPALSTTRTTTTLRPTTPKPRLCPPVPSAVIRRLLNGYPVMDICSHHGLIALSIDIPNVQTNSFRRITFCNAVMVFNPQSLRRELVMDDTCWDLLNSLEKEQMYRPVGTSQGVDFPISTSWALFSSNYTVSSTLASHKVAVPTVLMAGFLDSLVSYCDNTACLYNPETMSGAVDLSSKNCFLLSYGSSGFNPSTQGFDYNGLLRVNVAIVRNDKCGYMLFDTDIRCLELTPPDGLCIGDTSAGLFCPLATGETAFLGVTSFAPICTGTTMYVAISTNFISK